MRKIWLVIISVSLALIFFFMAHSEATAQSKPKSKFYDFGEQVIDGEIKKPTALYVDGRKKTAKTKKDFHPRPNEDSRGANI